MFCCFGEKKDLKRTGEKTEGKKAQPKATKVMNAEGK
jgi:hypothetical protein